MNDTEKLFLLARSAQSAWAALPVKKRAGRLLTLRETLINHTDGFLELLPANQSERFSALVGEILASVEQLTHTVATLPDSLASRSLRPLHLLNLHQKTLLHQTPLGVLLFVGSGNLPLYSALSRLAPALLSGNAVLLSSDGSAPVYERIVELCMEAGLPAGLVQFLHVPEGDFKAFIAGKPNKLFCWGSSEFSQRLRVLAAENQIPVHTEHLPAHVAILLPDADLDFASSALLSSLVDSKGSQNPGEHYFIHERLAEPFFSMIKKKLDQVPDLAANEPRVQSLLSRETTTPYRAVADLVVEINSKWASARVSLFSKNLYLAHDLARQLTIAYALVNEQPYAPGLVEISPSEFVRAQKIRLPRFSLFQFKAPWWLPHSSFQFDTFRTFLDLYRRHLTSRLRAIPLLLWNLIQMFKNERRL